MNEKDKEINEELIEEVTEETVEKEETKEEDKAETKKKKKIFEKKENVEELKIKISELEGEVAKLKNEYLKAYADTENTRKRLQTDFDNRQKYRIQSFALEILSTIDNLERAMNQPVDKFNESLHKGVEMIYQGLIFALKNEGVEEIEALDKEFDSAWHQAITTEHVDGVEPGIVLEVLQKGYKLKDRILRPSMVKVSE